MLVGGRLHRKTAVAKDDHTDLHAARLAQDKFARRGFGGFHARGFQIIGGHAARDVKGQDHGAFDARQADNCLRASEGNEQDRQAGEKEHGGDVAAVAKRSSTLLLHQAQRTIARDDPSPPSPHAQIEQHKEGDQEQKDQHGRPDKGHRQSASASFSPP